MGLIFIFHQNFGKNMLPWQTMTICVKHFVNIPDIYGNIFFSQNFCEICTFFKSSPFFFFIIFKASLKKYQEYYSSLLQQSKTFFFA
jgi:hypothetical protein